VAKAAAHLLLRGFAQIAAQNFCPLQTQSRELSREVLHSTLLFWGRCAFCFGLLWPLARVMPMRRARFSVPQPDHSRVMA
jgi:hypothetical protein